ncbi:MAG TPA: phosphate ABC transporter permease subunit PstC [Chthoniobacterales bacterium]|nr:phosphate ABC transporter permease subunit PstC [Chthoniobacterales bacterium]
MEITTPILPSAADNARRRSRQLAECSIKYFFGGNAVIAIVVLALITIFLFREGFGFFGENLRNLRIYRTAGTEYVDIIRAQAREHAELSRALNRIRLREFNALNQRGRSNEQAQAALAPFDQFATAFSDAGDELNGLVSDLNDETMGLKEAIAKRDEMIAERDRLLRAGQPQAAAQVVVPSVDRSATLAALRASVPIFRQTSSTLAAKLAGLLNSPPRLTSPAVEKQFLGWKNEVRSFISALPGAYQRLESWDPNQPIPWYRGITAFLFGRDWITASFWQDWYGIRPLLVGSIMVSFVALLIAVPVGVAAAIYVSEIAGRGEKSLVKPYIEFIAAIPSVVLGFFGIAVVGEAIRAASQSHWLSWVSFFPIAERLNAFTAGCLLALMAIPTIFTLSEDALRNVPRGFKEASYALGANRLQTIARVLVPASLSGIISAILLGFGRVIGETMVVLLCAGNRIEIPDFTEGIGAFFQPVHTMTGIIAQEMGEVVRGSIHYRALFMVGLVLFAITLVINYSAQKIVQRYRMSIG